MSSAEDIWRRKSDEEVAQAAGCLADYTEEGQALIRAEMSRRGIAEPPPVASAPEMDVCWFCARQPGESREVIRLTLWRQRGRFEGNLLMEATTLFDETNVEIPRCAQCADQHDHNNVRLVRAALALLALFGLLAWLSTKASVVAFSVLVVLFILAGLAVSIRALKFWEARLGFKAKRDAFPSLVHLTESGWRRHRRSPTPSYITFRR